jgi:hypothetical protein
MKYAVLSLALMFLTGCTIGAIGAIGAVGAVGAVGAAAARAPDRVRSEGPVEVKDFAEAEALCAQGLDAYCEAKEALRRNTAIDPKPRDANLCAEGYESYC